jgi:hypothetical protein
VRRTKRAAEQEKETEMTITAKFASVCPCCNVRIAVGTKVEWSKGNKARHVACAASGATVNPAATVSSIQASRRNWGRARGMGSGHGQASRMPGYSSYCTDNESCRCYDCAS